MSVRSAIVALVLFASLVPQIAYASDAAGSIAGTVRDGASAITSAVISLRSSQAYVAHSDAYGRFALHDLPSGLYAVEVSARGYNPLRGRVVAVRTGETTMLDAQMQRGVSSLVVIGDVRTSSGLSLSTSSAPVRDLAAQRFAARGYTSVAQMLSDETISTTLVRSGNALTGAPVAAALRGPDPTETLVDIDGHAVNSGGSGSFNLDLIDPAALSGVQVVYGISPSSLVGANTIDGAINIRTLGPTSDAHSLVRVSGGSFATFADTVQTTGTAKNVGYAFSFHDLNSDGSVEGSALDGASQLAKIAVPLDRGYGSITLSFYGQQENRDLDAALGVDDSTLKSHSANYATDVTLPMGRRDSSGVVAATLLLRHLSATYNQSVTGAANGMTPYLNNDSDLLSDDSVEFDRALPKSTFSVKVGLRHERLSTALGGTVTDQSIVHRWALDASDASGSSPSTMTQDQRTAAIRYEFEPTSKLHYTLAAYYSNYSTFGSSIDPRFGFVWTPTAQTAVRFSVGSTFQSPQLPELYIPSTLPPPDANGYVEIGNPALKADRSTNYDLGFEHIFAGHAGARLSADVYQTNLRTPSQRYLSPNTCPPADPEQCLSFPINAGGAMYRGIEISAQRSLGRVAVRAAYSVNSSFATSVSAQFQNGSIVVGEQSMGVPLHKWVLDANTNAESGLNYSAGLAYEDRYNELNRPAFATAHAGVAYRTHGLEIGVYGTNLTNVYANGTILRGQGIPYGGARGQIATDAYSIQPRTLQLILTRNY